MKDKTRKPATSPPGTGLSMLAMSVRGRLAGSGGYTVPKDMYFRQIL